MSACLVYLDKSGTDSLVPCSPHECPGVLPVDTVPSDGHEMTLGRHDVTQHGQVTVVHVDTVEGEDSVHLLLHRLPDRLDAETGEDLADVVTACSDGVNIPLRQNLGVGVVEILIDLITSQLKLQFNDAVVPDLHERRSVSLQNPLRDPLELPEVGQDDPLLVISARQVHVYLADRLQALAGEKKVENFQEKSNLRSGANLIHVPGEIRFSPEASCR